MHALVKTFYFVIPSNTFLFFIFLAENSVLPIEIVCLFNKAARSLSWVGGAFVWR